MTSVEKSPDEIEVWEEVGKATKVEIETTFPAFQNGPATVHILIGTINEDGFLPDGENPSDRV